MSQLDRLKAEVDALSRDDREALYFYLGCLIDEDKEPGYEEAWREEIERRVADLEANGTTSTLDFETVMEDLRRRFG